MTILVLDVTIGRGKDNSLLHRWSIGGSFANRRNFRVAIRWIDCLVFGLSRSNPRNVWELSRLNFVIDVRDFRVRNPPVGICCHNFVEGIVTGGYFTARQLCFDHRPEISQFPSARIAQLLRGFFHIVKQT